MSRDYILTCEDGKRYSFDNLATQRWLEGQAVGAQEVIDWLDERAVQLFRSKKTKEAEEMQRLAEEARKTVVPMLEARAARHKHEAPAEIVE